MKKMLTLIATLALVAIIALFVLGFISSDGAAPGLVDDRLARCPDTPNCVCSEYPEDATHYIEPVSLPDESPPAPLAAARAAIIDLGGSIETEHADYLAARFTSSLFRFVDDVEIRFDSAQRVLHIRSASRVGRSDLDANRKRVEDLRKRLARAFQTGQG